MKRLIIFICFTLCVPTPAIAGVANIKHMSRNSDGSFDVICSNGTLETVNLKAILDDSVCSKIATATVTDKPPSARPLLVCTGSWMHDYSITRISDNQPLGGFGGSIPRVSLAECQQAVKASTSEFVCTGSWMRDYSITRISNNQPLGDSRHRVSLAECQQTVKASSPEVANQQ
jgi:hypothetical protein